MVCSYLGTPDCVSRLRPRVSLESVTCSLSTARCFRLALVLVVVTGKQRDWAEGPDLATSEKRRRTHAAPTCTRHTATFPCKGVGTQRWSIAEIGDRMRSKLAMRKWIGNQKGELRFQCRYQNNRFQNKRHLLRKEWIYLKLRVTVPRKGAIEG